MDTKTTCEICKRPATEDNPVEPIDLYTDGPTLACDRCCEEILAELAILAALK